MNEPRLTDDGGREERGGESGNTKNLLVGPTCRPNVSFSPKYTLGKCGCSQVVPDACQGDFGKALRRISAEHERVSGQYICQGRGGRRRVVSAFVPRVSRITDVKFSLFLSLLSRRADERDGERGTEFRAHA